MQSKENVNVILQAVNAGHIVKYNSAEPRYYKKYDGVLYYSDRPDNYQQWKRSNSNDGIFENANSWTVL